MGTVKIGTQEIIYRVKPGKSTKYAHLRFTPDLELDVVLPRETDLDVEALLAKKRAWIARKYAELSNREPIFDGTSIMYEGRYYDLRMAPPTNEESVEREKDKIIIFAKGKEDSFSLLKEWMTKATSVLLERELPRFAQHFNINLGDVIVRDTKQWGYCSKTGALVFTWQLIALPKNLAEYVMLHELAHLSEFNHSKKFWTKLASMCPDFKERQQALNSFCTSKSAELDAFERITPERIGSKS
jgi:predicted metal-dependent hydrolase